MLRILLDENMPVRFRFLITGHHIETVRYCSWLGKQNGDLLRAAQEEFDVLVTVDKHMPDQQYLSQFNIALIVLRVKTPFKKELEAQFLKIPEVIDQIEKGKALVIEPE